MKDRGLIVSIAILLGAIALHLAVWGGIVFVAWHFIKKFW